jgi:hypothetical protein
MGQSSSDTPPALLYHHYLVSIHSPGDLMEGFCDEEKKGGEISFLPAQSSRTPFTAGFPSAPRSFFPSSYLRIYLHQQHHRAAPRKTPTPLYITEESPLPSIHDMAIASHHEDFI